MCISILMLGSRAEKAGRFMHTSAGLHIVVDVSIWLNVGFIFEPVSRDGFFVPERTHPLRETRGGKALTCGRLRAGDLVTLTSEDFESLTVQFQDSYTRTTVR
ncbi:hypothetical protein FOZ60_003609 [Perkinsus olseni]|nr:hypothetical protein FOZ60_003609 [Perkinsus olseni]